MYAHRIVFDDFAQRSALYTHNPIISFAFTHDEYAKIHITLPYTANAESQLDARLASMFNVRQYSTRIFSYAVIHAIAKSDATALTDASNPEGYFATILQETRRRHDEIQARLMQTHHGENQDPDIICREEIETNF